ncbi:MAG: DUF4836 family protein [Muribaculaceae bacterium]|nr:DUF4836 family protein [Muribaculaceae bacterium]
MKRINFLLALLAVLLMASCSSADEKLRALIPDDAVGVVRINLPSVLNKAGIKKGEDNEMELSIPANLMKTIEMANENLVDDVNIFGDVISNLPESGIDVKNNCYIFLSPGTYRSVALFHLDDEDKALEMVSKIAGGKMKEMSGIMFVSHLDYGYAIDDDVLMIGRYTIPVPDDKASAAAKKIIDRSTPSLLEKEEVSKAIDVKDCDITAYIDAKGLPLVYDNSDLKPLMGEFSPMDLLAGSGIKAMTATVNFNDSKKGEEKVEIVTDFICASNSMYGLIYDKIIATADGGDATEALAAVPGDFDTYFAVKVNGAGIMNLPGSSMLFDNLNTFPLTNGVNCKGIISSINGALVFGMQQFGDMDYNLGVSAQSTAPEMVVNEIVNIANQRGQAPYKNANGEYVYDDNYSNGDKAIVMSNNGGVVYMRYINYVPTTGADSWPALAGVLNTSRMVLFHQVKVNGTPEGCLCWGLRNKTHGEGFYFTLDENENIVQSALKFLCWREPSSIEYEDIGLADYY